MSSAIMLLAPEHDTSRAGTRFEERIHTLWYRGEWRARRKVRGTSYTFLLNRGESDGIDIGASFGGSDEAGQLAALAELFGGHYLAVWTFGEVLHHLYLRGNPDGGGALALHLGVRRSAFNGKRPAHALNDLLEWFAEAPFAPDVKALAREYASERISVVGWLKAFGVSGAREPEARDGEITWQEFREAAVQLTVGEKPAAGTVRRVNTLAAQAGEGIKVPRQPPRRAGRLADSLVEVHQALTDVLGASSDPWWCERERAAGWYWDFSDCAGSRARIIVGRMDDDIAESAALVRVMMHYPAEFYRDGPFWMLAASQAEGANGHAFVRAMRLFAGSCHAAGFVLAVVPAAERVALRDAFGLQPHEDDPGPDSGYHAEAFVELPGLPRADIEAQVAGWYSQARADGRLLIGAPDGEFRLRYFAAGAEVGGATGGLDGARHDARALADATAGLDFRGVCRALGLPDLFEPGEWTEGAYGGQRTPGDQVQEAERARRAVAHAKPNDVEARTIADSRWLFPLEDIRRPAEEGMRTAVEVYRFWFDLPDVNEDYARELRDDMRAYALAGRYGDVWWTPDSVYGQVIPSAEDRDLTMRSLWRGVLGGVPDGTRLTFEFADIEQRCWTSTYRVDSAAERESLAAQMAAWQAAEKDSPPPGLAREDAVEADADELDDDDDDDDDDETFELEVEFSTQFSGGVDDESLFTERLLSAGERIHYALDVSRIEHLAQHAIGPALAGLTALGGRVLGDLFVNELSAAFYRVAVIDTSPEVWVTMEVAPFETVLLGFFSEFEDGSSITTTSAGFVMPMPERGVHYETVEEDMPPDQRLAHHLAAVARHCERGAVVVPIGDAPDVARYAAVFERFLQRTSI